MELDLYIFFKEEKNKFPHPSELFDNITKSSPLQIYQKQLNNIVMLIWFL
jgi:hypothetical protein